MKRYEVYTYIGDRAHLRYETNDINEACDIGDKIEKTSTEEFDGTILYDNLLRKWFGKHKKGSAYILSR